MKPERKSSSGYEAFRSLMDKLLEVPHADIKAKLDAEKKAKRGKKPRKSSASRDVNDRA